MSYNTLEVIWAHLGHGVKLSQQREPRGTPEGMPVIQPHDGGALGMGPWGYPPKAPLSTRKGHPRSTGGGVDTPMQPTPAAPADEASGPRGRWP